MRRENKDGTKKERERRKRKGKNAAWRLSVPSGAAYRRREANIDDGSLFAVLRGLRRL